MRSFAVLVDGGFIKRRLGSEALPFGRDDFSRFLVQLNEHPRLAECSLHRVYFYDAAPLNEKKRKPLGGGMLDFGGSETARRNTALHTSLVRLPFVALRMGELNFRGWGVAPDALPDKADQATITAADIRPSIQQKGVDMRIGLDIAALTLKRIADVIVLVTADSDFVPAMKFARREGAQLFLVPLGNPMKETMREHSDLVIECEVDHRGTPTRPIVLLP
jgi:uncharacterized LabA/DUF88 family protein